MQKETLNSGIVGGSNIQVVLSAHNSIEYLPRCLDSIEKSLKGYKWIMVFGDDGSADDTLGVAVEYSKKSSATRWYIKKFTKAKNVTQAKNRVLNMAKEKGQEYPIICFMDSDDEMLPDRISHLLPRFQSEETKIVVGDYIMPHYEGYTEYIKADGKNVKEHLRFGIWATLFHESLIPESGGFFDEKMDIYSDFLKWWSLRHKDGVSFDFCAGKPVHVFHRRKNSISGKTLRKNLNKIKEEKDRIYKLV